MELVRAVKKDPRATEELNMAVDLYLRGFTTPGVERDLLMCLDRVPNGIDIYEMIETALENEDDDKRIKALRTTRHKEQLCQPVYEHVSAGPHSHQGGMHAAPYGHAPAAWGHDGYAQPGPPPPPHAQPHPNYGSGLHPLPTTPSQQSGVWPIGHGQHVHAHAPSTGNWPAAASGYGGSAAPNYPPQRAWNSGGYPQVADDLGYSGPIQRQPTGNHAPLAHPQEPSSPWSASAIGPPSYAGPSARPVTGVLSTVREDLRTHEPPPLHQGGLAVNAYGQTMNVPTGSYEAAAVDITYGQAPDTPIANHALPSGSLDALYDVPVSRRETATTGMFTSLTDYLDKQGDSVSTEIQRRAKRRVAMMAGVAAVVVVAILWIFV